VCDFGWFVFVREPAQNNQTPQSFYCPITFFFFFSLILDVKIASFNFLSSQAFFIPVANLAFP